MLSKRVILSLVIVSVCTLSPKFGSGLPNPMQSCFCFPLRKDAVVLNMGVTGMPVSATANAAPLLLMWLATDSA